MWVRNGKWLKLTGNTYPNKDKIRACCGTYDPDARCWWINLATHPLNNIKQRGELEKKIVELASLGVVLERKESRE